MVAYHDAEWGVPVRDDSRHFEFLVLDAFQAGLSWSIILNKREGFRAAFADFDAAAVARFGPTDVGRLRSDPAIVRNRQKIEATIANARSFLSIQDEFGSFDRFVWRFVADRTIPNLWAVSGDVPAKTEESEAMSAALRARGFTFVGPTICYAYMQAAGMVNDHTVDCFRHAKVAELARG